MIIPRFITGFARSGTTLMTTLVGRHPEICSPPETTFFETVYKKLAPWLAEDYYRQAMTVNPRLLDLDLEPDALSKVEGEDVGGEAFLQIMDSYAKKQGVHYWVEKSPHHILFIRTILKKFPDARFVITVRDPRDCVSSLDSVPWAHSSEIRHLAEWKVRYSYALKCKNEFPKNILMVKYEDLVFMPTETLSKVMRFLGFEFVTGQLNAELKSEAVPSWESSWKEKVNTEIDASRAYSWKKQKVDNDLASALCAPLLGEFNYDICPSEVSTLNKVYFFILTTRIYRNIRLFCRHRNIYDN